MCSYKIGWPCHKHYMKSFVVDSILKYNLLFFFEELFGNFWSVHPLFSMLGKSLFILLMKGTLIKMLRMKGKARECFASGNCRGGDGKKVKKWWGLWCSLRIPEKGAMYSDSLLLLIKVKAIETPERSLRSESRRNQELIL